MIPALPQPPEIAAANPQRPRKRPQALELPSKPATPHANARKRPSLPQQTRNAPQRGAPSGIVPPFHDP